MSPVLTIPTLSLLLPELNIAETAVIYSPNSYISHTGH